MYLPKHFEETDRIKAFDLIRDNPLATLVLNSDDALNANHIPFYLEPDKGTNGMLLGHAPRANPLTATKVVSETLAIFHGPNSYITPSWYPTKKETGEVVPTWNYQVVHIHGDLRIIDDPDWVLAKIELLTDHNESKFSDPWRVTDVPQEFTTRMLKVLVGIEIEITEIIFKSKVSQNQPDKNRLGVAKGLNESKSTVDKEMSEIVRQTKPK